MMHPPLIVSARFEPVMQQALDALRAKYFPSARNHLKAHLTLLHAVPAPKRQQLQQLLEAVTRQPLPPAHLTGLMRLGRGFAIRVQAPTLQDIRGSLQQALWQDLTSQDQQPLRPHVTLQNKVEPARAAADLANAEQTFVPAHSAIVSLCLWEYQGGPWSFVRAYPFEGTMGDP